MNKTGFDGSMAQNQALVEVLIERFQFFMTCSGSELAILKLARFSSISCLSSYVNIVMSEVAVGVALI